jgi:hypothetical protein
VKIPETGQNLLQSSVQTFPRNYKPLVEPVSAVAFCFYPGAGV